jgi:hypothetical protein
MYWPEYKGELYLNTEEKMYAHPGLNIICSKVGKNSSFGITFRKGLDQVKSDNIMLIMIDYIFMGKVNNEKINEYYDYFKKNELDSLALIHQVYDTMEASDHYELNHIYPPSPLKMFSFQIAFWKKSMLYQMVLPHENPWTSECFGTLRAQKMKIKLTAIAADEYNPIPYHLAGCLHKGKWLNEAIEFLNKIHYYVDFSKRGLYHETSINFKMRLKIKWMIVKHGLIGSYLDLVKR